MNRLIHTILIWSASVALVTGDDRFQSRVDFENDLIPLFTKHGCNSGACHGAAIGRGGFKLSLYGGAAEEDYETVVRQLGGRRVNLAKPEESLIVLKPTEHIAHGGGTVFDADSQSARMLIEWVRGGVVRDSGRQFQSLSIEPQKHIANKVGDTVSLRAVARYADGTQRDVTEWTVFTAEDATAVEMSRESSQATIRRRGRHIVIARYLDIVQPIEMIMPLSDVAVGSPKSEPQQSFIDQEIHETLAVLRLESSEPANDASFLRRLSLDLTGRLPSESRLRAFLADTGDDRRSRLVDELLASDAFTEFWTFQFAKLFRVHADREDAQGMQAYHQWLANQIGADASYQQMARTLIVAEGDTHESGPANFYRTVNGAREQAELASEVFMGSRLRCANCHNHPLDRWTQDDYHGLAAIFAKVERGRIIRAKPAGEAIHARTLEPAMEKIPGGEILQSGDENGRERFAAWLIAADNPYFAKAIVNRLWRHMMGRGLVEPVDDFRDTNPATHPALLEKLANDFASNGYRIRYTLRIIATSNAYARSSKATEQNRDDDRFYSHALRRPLEAEVLADAISDVLGVPIRYGELPLGTRAVSLIDPKTPSPALDVLGRCGREASCEDAVDGGSGITQKLYLLNGPLLNARIADEGGRLQELLDSQVLPIEIVKRFYRIALGRNATAVEVQHWQSEIQAATDTKLFLEDFVWGVLTSREFVSNH